MESSLQSYDECMKNRRLFVVYNGQYSGKFINSYNDGVFCFYWFDGGVHHRLDGPAYISNSKCIWYFWGEYLEGVKSQNEFIEWLVDNVKI